ncbi:MAG TPA: SGNH/GDSL hydrolase family protein [Gemmatimonadaceae bacterium]|jgi:lysophospholipase L1-like esterase|nr:SGNH/GDSL hydrolase family protein [Gemmatimonadaceae bacterium]
MLRLNNLTRVAVVGAALALAACSDDPKLLGPASPAGGDIFKSYVAIGNSITAGYQSSGINDSTQRQSYARLLAVQMGTRYHYAALAIPGCPPPISNILTGARIGGATAPPCALRTNSSVTDILNNVAVPGARVLDPTSASTVASNALTTFILGGKTQVQRALDADPTFATIWIGNNDVLEAGASGVIVPTPGVSPGIVSTQAQFQASYDAMIQQLVDSEPNLKGVLIGVVQVAGIPLLQSGALIASSPAIQAAINQLAGQPVTIHPNCTGSASLVSVPQLIPLIRSGAHPALISCEAGVVPGTLVGDLFVLDATEQATLGATIAGYNNYIKSKADAIGFAYYDPNVLLAAKKASGEIPPFPDFSKPTAPFGAFISLDGIHPAAAAHKAIANDLITVINAKYGTSLKPVP